jgi:hypothetical protein
MQNVCMILLYFLSELIDRIYKAKIKEVQLEYFSG